MNANRHYAHQYPTTRTPPAAKKASGDAKLLQASLGPQYNVTCEVRFHKSRKWRIDLVVERDRDDAPDIGHIGFDCTRQPLAIEIDGGLFVRGRHTRGAEMQKSMEKDYHAMLAGFRVLHVSTSMLKDGRARDWIVELLK